MLQNIFTVDFHSHIIPGADHGCHSKEEFESQMKLYRNAGIDAVVATPHFYPNQHSISGFLSTVDASYAENCVSCTDKTPRIYLGAEVLVCENIHRMPDLEKLCIRNTNILLLELPLSGCSSSLIQSVEKVIEQDYTVVLAHIDRYLPRYAEDIHNLLDAGAYAQINATAFSGFHGEKKLLPYLKSGKVVAFGSDLHETDKKSIRAFENLVKLPHGFFAQTMEKTVQLLQVE